MNDKLERCPFCGGKPQLSERFQAAKIWCNSCEIQTNLYPTKKGAIAVWNRRADTEESDIDFGQLANEADADERF